MLFNSSESSVIMKASRKLHWLEDGLEDKLWSNNHWANRSTLLSLPTDWWIWQEVWMSVQGGAQDVWGPAENVFSISTKHSPTKKSHEASEIIPVYVWSKGAKRHIAEVRGYHTLSLVRGYVNIFYNLIQLIILEVTTLGRVVVVLFVISWCSYILHSKRVTSKLFGVTPLTSLGGHSPGHCHTHCMALIKM